MDILDLDHRKRESKIVKIGGREIDVSIVPTATTILMDKIVETARNLQPGQQEEMEKKYVDAIMITIKRNSSNDKYYNSKITEEWLRENCSIDDFMQILLYMHSHIKKKEEKTEDIQTA